MTGRREFLAATALSLMGLALPSRDEAQMDGDLLGAIRMAAEKVKGGALGKTTEALGKITDQTERITRKEQE